VPGRSSVSPRIQPQLPIDRCREGASGSSQESYGGVMRSQGMEPGKKRKGAHARQFLRRIAMHRYGLRHRLMRFLLTTSASPITTIRQPRAVTIRRPAHAAPRSSAVPAQRRSAPAPPPPPPVERPRARLIRVQTPTDPMLICSGGDCTAPTPTPARGEGGLR
jgi:hypothetical protein